MTVVPSLRNPDLGKVLIKLKRDPKIEIKCQLAWSIEQWQKGNWKISQVQIVKVLLSHRKEFRLYFKGN